MRITSINAFGLKTNNAKIALQSMENKVNELSSNVHYASVPLDTLKAYSINKISFEGLKKENNSIPVILLMGPPLSGKGTISEEISKRNGIPAISVGAILRKNIEDKTELGIKVKPYVDKGLLVPSELAIAVVKDRVSQPDCREGFILDGFPRKQDDAVAFDEMYEESIESGLKWRPRAVMFIASEELLLDRQKRRAEKEHRSDDTPEIFKDRLKVYYEETIPVIDVIREKGYLRELPVEDENGAEKSIEDVYYSTMELIEEEDC